MSVVIHTVGIWIGVTFPFFVYSGASSTVAFLAGPPGWIIGGVLLLTGVAVWAWPKSDVDRVASFVMTLNAIKASKVKDFNLEKDPYVQVNPYMQHNPNGYGQNPSMQQIPYGYGPFNPNIQINSGNSQEQIQRDNHNTEENETQKNNSDAFDMWKKAAEQGNPEAMYNLGKYYHYGYGIEKNYPEAVKGVSKGCGTGKCFSTVPAWHML